MERFPVFGLAFLLVLATRNAALAGDRAGNTPEPQRSSLRFVENLGQWPEPIRFLAEFSGSRVRAECDAIGIELFQTQAGAASGNYWRLCFEGSSSTSPIEGFELLPGSYNYFLGNDPARWQVGARAYERLRWHDLYPGIDLVLREAGAGIEYDILVAAGADLGQIALRCEGAEGPHELGQGAFSLKGRLGDLLHVPGRCFELTREGAQRELACIWWQNEQGSLRVEVPERDPELALVIDPELVWSTYLGGPSHERANAVTWDGQGNVTVVGNTTAFGFPQTPGAFQAPQNQVNAFVTRFTGSGELVFSSVFGGTGGAIGTEIGDVAVSSNGETVVVGETGAPDFPVTPGAFDTTKDTSDSWAAGFVTRLAAHGNMLVYSTFLEGNQYGPVGLRVALDSQGRAIISGGAKEDFPVTDGAYQTVPGGPPGSGDGFVTRLNRSGSAIEWSTFLGGSAVEVISDLVVGSQDRITLTGRTSSQNFPTTPGAWKTTLGAATLNAFVCRLDADGSNLLWSTYLGGSTLGRSDYALGVAVTEFGDAVVSGYTNSPTYPVTPGAFQTEPQIQWNAGFVSRLVDGGQALVYSTFLLTPYGGGACRDVAVDPSGVVTVSGKQGQVFPITPGSYDTTTESSGDSAIVRLSPDLGRLFYASFLGGPGEDSADRMSMTSTGRVVLAGQSWVTSQAWPVTQNAYQPYFGGGNNDAVVTVLDLLFQGVRQIGISIPSCNGPLVANATEMPASGSSNFSLYCSGAPPSTSGVLLLGYASQSLQRIGGVASGLHPLYLIVPALSNAEGFVEVPVPLLQATAGSRFTARFVFPSTPACPSAGPISASNGLLITIQ